MAIHLQSMRRWRRGLVMVAGVALALFAAVYLVAVRTAVGQGADNAALIGADHRPTTAIAQSGALLDTISVVGLAMVGGFLCLIGLAREGWRLASAAGGVILGANVATQLLKHEALTRPNFAGVGNEQGWGNSFPSGHATVAMSLVVAAALVLPPRSRPLAVIPLAVYAVAIGVATLTAGWHRPSDVVGAMLLTTGIGALAAKALLRWGVTGDGANLWNPRLATRRAPVLLGSAMVAIAVLAVALLALVGVVLGDAWGHFDARRVTAAYIAGGVVIAACGALTTSALLGVLAGIDLGAIDDVDAGPAGQMS